TMGIAFLSSQSRIIGCNNSRTTSSIVSCAPIGNSVSRRCSRPNAASCANIPETAPAVAGERSPFSDAAGADLDASPGISTSLACHEPGANDLPQIHLDIVTL